MRVLVVTAVAAEADSVAAGLDRFAGSGVRELTGGYEITGHAQYMPRPGSVQIPVVDVLAGGVGPTAAAVATATALAASPYDPPYHLVISAGIGGGFRHRAPVGSLVVADRIVAADLGAESADGYLPVEKLGFGRSVHRPPAELTARIAKLLDAAPAGGTTGTTAGPATTALLAPVLTVSTVTGTAARAAELTARHPLAAAEAMEGFGVAEAAAVHSVPCVEIRAISNAVGPRDRDSWEIGRALEALRYAFTLLTPVFEEPS
ncbi:MULTISPECIES: futalosine hydrolase [unclassified Streptomyces]|uniref:futalosine hydrolase n=1 Tax=unclassified Streptomyces TaxID=2593676 RepID=UPI00081EEA92|nr:MULTISPECIES: futalosine hydrolase [unclassified Streptomyces]MYZ36342.1 futalosine hydrolase [Streptomyces sp. SID4917]SCF82817.1 futalosine hydrolase [Streptomyces sp. MnatMP-M17]